LDTVLTEHSFRNPHVTELVPWVDGQDGPSPFSTHSSAIDRLPFVSTAALPSCHEHLIVPDLDSDLRYADKSSELAKETPAS
jgi:hypothetical protein